MGKIKYSISASVLFIIFASACAAADRMLLWHVLQACVANNRLLGAAFPCLEVNVARDSDAGFAVLRAPFEATHIVVTPTTRITGIESPELQAANAPNYIKEAWDARHYVADRVGRPSAWDDLGLAVNSASGRSQDQLHIHIDCVQPYVRDLLRESAKRETFDNWVHLKVPIQGVRYWVLFLDSPDLGNVNVFKLANSGLHIKPGEEANLSVALIGGLKSGGQKGFYLFADLSSPRTSHGGHAEYLLDHACADHR
jgi:CDP-diacylglycerol pyrophosphatase